MAYVVTGLQDDDMETIKIETAGSVIHLGPGTDADETDADADETDGADADEADAGDSDTSDATDGDSTDSVDGDTADS